MNRNYLTRRQRERLWALLLKEDFRRLINSSKKSEDYIIDTVGYTSVPNVTACFKSGDLWKVYDTDDRAQVLDECVFSNAYSAYKNAAERRGLSFHWSIPSHWIRSNHISPQMAKALETASIRVLKNVETIAKLLEGEESGVAAAADAKFLQHVLTTMHYIQAEPVFSVSTAPTAVERLHFSGRRVRFKMLEEEIQEEKNAKEQEVEAY